MKIQDNLLRWMSLTLPIFIILISQSQSHATQTQPILDNLTIDGFINKILKYRKSYQMKFQGGKGLKLSGPTILAGVFCFMAASISSAGGIGGGGLYIPILTILAGLDLKTASSFSAFMVTGGSIANVMYNLRAKSANFGGKTLIDFDIALLSEPCMLLGVSVGVVCNLVFPEWLITILFAIFLAWSTFKTCRNGVGHWKMESELQETKNGYEKLESGVIQNGNCGESGEIKSLEEPLIDMERKEKSRFPWKKLVVLIMVWFSFFAIYLLRGNSYGQVPSSLTI